MNDSTANTQKLYLVRVISTPDYNDRLHFSISLSWSLNERCEIVADSHTSLFSTMLHNVLKIPLCWAPPRVKTRAQRSCLPEKRNMSENMSPNCKNTRTKPKASYILAVNEADGKMQGVVPRGGAEGSCQVPLPCPFPAPFLSSQHRTRKTWKHAIPCNKKRNLPNGKCRSLPFRLRTKTTRN